MDWIPAETSLGDELPRIQSVQLALPLILNTEPKVSVSPKADKAALRATFRASTLDGLFAAIFVNTAGGVLLSNFLIELQASPTQVGLLASMPMLANLMQPLGAYWSNRTPSRRCYGQLVYGPSRLLWLGLVVGIAIAHQGHLTHPQLIHLTLAIVLLSNALGALGSASWLSWLAAMVPHQLRGRYFGLRNSVASLTSLLTIPLGGLIVSRWPGGMLQGYSGVLLLGIGAGLVSLGFQTLMLDINPQEQLQILRLSNPAPPGQRSPVESPQADQLLLFLETVDPDLPQGTLATAAPKRRTANPEPQASPVSPEDLPLWRNGNFLRFLGYFAVWTFAANLSAPFFNFYLLDTLALDVSLVTLYNSLSSAANLLLMLLWGRLADRFGNRFLLLGVGVLVALTPLLWLGTGTDGPSLWLWFPLLHLLGGGTWAAIELCTSNLQMGIAPMRHHANYFAIAAALGGVSGALGTTVGGLLVETPHYGGVLSVFALSSVLRLAALLPLVCVREGKSIRQMVGTWVKGAA